VYSCTIHIDLLLIEYSYYVSLYNTSWILVYRNFSFYDIQTFYDDVYTKSESTVCSSETEKGKGKFKYCLERKFLCIYLIRII